VISTIIQNHENHKSTSWSKFCNSHVKHAKYIEIKNAIAFTLIIYTKLWETALCMFVAPCCSLWWSNNWTTELLVLVVS